MNTSLPIHVGAVLFDGFELLDFYGPLEMFGLLEAEAKITVVAEKKGFGQEQLRSVGCSRSDHGRFWRV